MPLQKLPTQSLDDINHRRRARETINQILDHSFDDSRVRTSAEVAAGITPVNHAWPPYHIHRYGAVGDGVTDDLPAIDRAVAVASIAGGVVTGEQLPYLVDGTVLVSGGPVSFDFHNSIQSPTVGARFISNANAPILRFSSGAYGGYGVRGLTLVGGVIPVSFTASVGGATSGTLTANWSGVGGAYSTVFRNGEVRTVTVTNGATSATWSGALSAGTITSALVNVAGTSQDGLVIDPTYPAQALIYAHNVAIFYCGRHGLNLATSYGSTFSSIYVQQCAAVGILDGPNTGANKWYNVASVFNGSTGIDVVSTNGSSEWFGLNAEQNPIGISFESGAVGHTMYGVHTEANTTNSLLFKSGSNRNRVDFEQWGGGSEPEPVNSGGAQNRWSGNQSGGTILYDAKVVQRVSTISRAVVGGVGTTMPFDDTPPTTSEGFEVLSESITPQAPGNTIVVRAWGFAEVNAGTVMTIALYEDAATDAVAAYAQDLVNPSTPQRFYIEYETSAASPIGTAKSFAVRVGSDNGANYTVTMGGTGGARRFGGIATAGICIEEQYPSSG
jgi:hypothetical protein